MTCLGQAKYQLKLLGDLPGEFSMGRFSGPGILPVEFPWKELGDIFARIILQRCR